MVGSTRFDDDPHFTFRVVRFSPNPTVALDPSQPWLLEIEHTGGGRERYGISDERYLRYRDVLRDALSSQQVYWANVDFSNESRFTLGTEPNRLDRMLNAASDRQFEEQS